MNNMWNIRVLNLKTNKTFELTLNEYKFYEYKKATKHSNKVRIISEMRVF